VSFLYLEAGWDSAFSADNVKQDLLDYEIIKCIERERLDILDSIRDAFFAIDKDWWITLINRRAAQNGGYEPDELTGRNIWEAFPKLLGTQIEPNNGLLEKRE